ncbi:MAG: S49 family peptidase [Phycisphaerales bacterium]|nr:S49 family peptidase [Phycisphaerales bacterium]
MGMPKSLVAGVVGLAASLAFADANVAMVEVSGSLAEQPGSLAWLRASDSFDTLDGLISALQGIAADDSLDGVVIRLKDAQLPRVQVQEIGQAIERIRDSGKRVHVFAENYGDSEILLGSYADERIVQAGGSVTLTGLHMEEMFLADTLSWLGIKADMVQVGDYKGADEMYMQSKPTPAWDWNINQLLDGLYDGMRSQLRTNLGLTDEQLDSAMATGWFSDASAAIDAGLVSAEVDLPVLTDYLQDEYGDDVAWREITPEPGLAFDAMNPFAMLKTLMTPPDHTPDRETIAVLHVVGTIVDGESSPGGLMGGESVGSRTIRNALEEILDEPLVRGVVVRIDSPGGSAIASEVIWQGLRRVAAEKPVWVSVGSMAASGGYYTAVGGDKIYVNPSSLVGSIGVVGGKFSMGELYEKLHVHFVERSRGPRANLFSSVEAWSPEERAFVKGKMAETYRLFTSRVEAGRPGIDLTQTAEGRLFTGTRAIEMGMADEIGTLDDTISGLAAELGLDEYDVMDYPGPKSFEEVVQGMLGGMVTSPVDGRLEAARAAAELLGPNAWRQVSNAGRALLQFREEPVQAVMPRVMIFD